MGDLPRRQNTMILVSRKQSIRGTTPCPVLARGGCCRAGERQNSCRCCLLFKPPIRASSVFNSWLTYRTARPALPPLGRWVAPTLRGALKHHHRMHLQPRHDHLDAIRRSLDRQRLMPRLLKCRRHLQIRDRDLDVQDWQRLFPLATGCSRESPGWRLCSRHSANARSSACRPSACKTPPARRAVRSPSPAACSRGRPAHGVS